MALDVIDQVGAVRREARSAVRDGKPVRVVAAAQSYDAEIADVWDAITNAERIPRWFLPISGELRLGGRYSLEGNADGEILECDPPSRLAVTWEFGGDVTWLEVRLDADGDRTTLELEHSAQVPPERWAEFGPGAVGVGWDLTLMGLAQHLGPGAPSVEPATAMAWMGSDEGLAFMARSSDAWADAAIAGGDDEIAARAAADRTIAAYTGSDATADAPDG